MKPLGHQFPLPSVTQEREMKRLTKTVYASDSGRELIVLKPDSEPECCAYVAISHCSIETLEELSAASLAAAEELRSLREVTIP
jgi:hypothetical protein